MAKTEYVYLLPDVEDQFYQGLRSGDRFVYARFARKITNFSRKRKKGMTNRSLLPQISVAWATLTPEQKTAWSEAGAKTNLNGWRLFVQDMCARMKNDIAGIATPSLLHQSWVGKLTIEAPDNELKIVQIHPRYYYISKKVRGKKGMYIPIQITEDLAFPFVLSLNYKSELESVAEGSFAKLYARFWYSYQGQDLFHELTININSPQDWVYAEATLTALDTYVIRYDLYFHIQGMRGSLYFDNVSSFHSGQNWCRDPFCKDINQGFTRAFYQIPKHWASIILPAGAWFDSAYKDFV